MLYVAGERVESKQFGVGVVASVHTYGRLMTVVFRGELRPDENGLWNDLWCVDYAVDGRICDWSWSPREDGEPQIHIDYISRRKDLKRT